MFGGCGLIDSLELNTGKAKGWANSTIHVGERLWFIQMLIGYIGWVID